MHVFLDGKMIALMIVGMIELPCLRFSFAASSMAAACMAKTWQIMAVVHLPSQNKTLSHETSLRRAPQTHVVHLFTKSTHHESFPTT